MWRIYESEKTNLLHCWLIANFSSAELMTSSAELMISSAELMTSSAGKIITSAELLKCVRDNLILSAYELNYITIYSG